MDSFTIVLIIVGVVCFALYLWIQSMSNKMHDSINSKLKGVEVTKRLNLWGETIAFNEEKEMFYHVLPNELKEIPFSKIISSEIKKDGETKVKSSLTGAVVGGIVAGGVGAIIGSGIKGKTKEIIKSLELEITVNSLESPIHSITFYTHDKHDSKDNVGEAIENIETWYGILRVIVERNKK